MSFFGSLLGDFEDDPFTGHMRQMNRMMNTFFHGSPFGGMMGGSTDMMPFDNRRGRNEIMPFGILPEMGRMFPMPIDQNAANCHSFSSSTVLTMSNGPDGRPQVYQASQSVRAGPGGVRETKKSVADSRTGVKKLAIGHHIGERSHIVEREQNLHSGEREEREEFINLDEEEAPEFNREWQTRARNYSAPHNSLTYPSSATARYPGGGRHPHDNVPMLPPAPSQSRNRPRAHASSSRRSNHARYPALPPPTSNGVVITEESYKSEDEAEEEDDGEGVKIVELDDDDDDNDNDEVVQGECDVEEEEKVEPQQCTYQRTEKSRKRLSDEPDTNYRVKVLRTKDHAVTK